MSRLITALVLVLVATAASAAEPLPKAAEKFDVAGHTAFLYAAPKPAPGKPWVWYAPTLKGVSLVGRKAYYEGFLNAGVSIAGFDLGEVRGSPQSSAQFTLFYDEMVKRGFSAKPILLGQSRGGLMMLAWAVRNPQHVQAFVGIYPVCNLSSWPMKNKAVTLADYQLTDAELQAKLPELNPLDNLKGLLERKVPMFVVHGDVDAAVPYEENTKILKERYEAGGGPITVKVIKGEGHKESPSFFECKELVEFVLTQAEGGAEVDPVDQPASRSPSIMAFTTSFFKPSMAADVKEIETWIGTALPQVYRRFLSEHSDDLEISDLVVLYGLSSFVERNETYETKSYCPGFVTIGDDSGGRQIILSLNDETVWIVDAGAMTQDRFDHLTDDVLAWITGGCPLPEDVPELYPAVDHVHVYLERKPSTLKSLLLIKQQLAIPTSIGDLKSLLERVPCSLTTHLTYAQAIKRCAKVNATDNCLGIRMLTDERSNLPLEWKG